MSSTALSQQQSRDLHRILKTLRDECDSPAIVVCDLGGNILADCIQSDNLPIGNAAALAAGAFAATRALAQIIGEPGFRSIAYKGTKSGMLIQSVGGDYLILILLGVKTTEGLVRLYLKKIGRQIAAVLVGANAQSLEAAGVSDPFEIEETPEPPAAKP